MDTLLVIGAGGHGAVVADAALSSERWRSLSFVDDVAKGSFLGFDIIGAINDLEKLASKHVRAVVAIGDNRKRLQLVQRCRAAGDELPPVVHPPAVVSRFATVGVGTVLLAQSVVCAGASIGEACIVNTGATVDHDCELAD